MSDSRLTSEDSPRELKRRAHPNCVVCSPSNAIGLRLDFSVGEGGSVAWIASSHWRLHLLEASLEQSGQEAAHAKAKFIER